MSSSFTPESERQRLQFLVREICISWPWAMLVSLLDACLHSLKDRNPDYGARFSLSGSPAAVAAGERVHTPGVSQKGHEKRAWEEDAVPRLHHERMVRRWIWFIFILFLLENRPLRKSPPDWRVKVTNQSSFCFYEPLSWYCNNRPETQIIKSLLIK